MTAQEFIQFTNKCANEKEYVINPHYHITLEQFYEIMVDVFISKDWYIVDPIGREQEIAYIADKILHDHYNYKEGKFKRLIKRIFSTYKVKGEIIWENIVIRKYKKI